MRNAQQAVTWVVYKMTQHGNHSAMSAVCEQHEWDAMEAARPGYHTLIRAGITNEAEAELLARDTSGFVAAVPKPRKTWTPAETAAAPAAGTPGTVSGHGR